MGGIWLAEQLLGAQMVQLTSSGSAVAVSVGDHRELLQCMISGQQEPNVPPLRNDYIVCFLATLWRHPRCRVDMCRHMCL